MDGPMRVGRSSPEELKLVAYGPDPSVGYRTGGVAVWMRYLNRLAKAASLPVTMLYADERAISVAPGMKTISIVAGVLRSAIRLAGSNRGGRSVAHLNTSLYPQIAYRDASIVLAARMARIPVLLQVHGGRLSNLKNGTVATRTWKWMFRTVELLGVYPGPQWDEFQAAGYGAKMRPMCNVVPRSGRTARTRDRPAHFLFLGRLTEEKGAMCLLSEFQRVRDAGHREAHLTFAGDGPLFQVLQESVERRDLGDAVSLEGFVEGRRRDQVMDQANVFVLPSRHQEGFPLAFLECAERGMACIVTMNSAIPEVFDQEEQFLSVDLDNEDDLFEQMSRVAVSEDLRAALGEAVQSRVQAEFTIEGAAPRFRELYGELISRSCS